MLISIKLRGPNNTTLLMSKVESRVYMILIIILEGSGMFNLKGVIRRRNAK